MSGWGTLTSGGRQPEELMEVTVTTMTNTQVETVIDSLPTKHLLQKHFSIHFSPSVHQQSDEVPELRYIRGHALCWR